MGWNPLRARRQQHLEDMDAFRSARKLVDEDISVFGEQLTEVDVEAATTPLDSPSMADYQKARDSHELAKSLRAAAATTEDLVALDPVLHEGRYHLACVLARRDGIDLPTRRDPCFFNPQHGPAVVDVPWTPQGEDERSTPVCRRDADRLAAGEAPDVRLVRVGDRYVPWYAAGGSIEGVARQSSDVLGGRTSRTDKHVDTGRMASDLSKAGWIKR